MRLQYLIGLTVALAISIGFVFSVPLDDSNTERIIGGSTANRGQFAYQISLRRRKVIWNATLNSNETLYLHSCGGSILNERWLITVAHCMLTPNSTANIIAVVAAHHVHTDGIRYPLDRVIVHPNYVSFTNRNDIALLRTRRIIQFHAKIQPIAISHRYVEEGVAAITSGWGQTEIGDLPEYLKYAKVFTLSNKECIARHEELQAVKIFDTTLCTFKTAGLGTCFGDSGGPLVYNKTLIGLVSWGVPCARGKPDMFTRVSEYVDWIVKITGLEVVN